MKRLGSSLLAARAGAAVGRVRAGREPDEETKFDPSHEWELQTWGPELKIGPIDMSINKAVAYLLLGTLVLDRSSGSCSCA